jgi:hypothetical protein
VVNKLIPDSMAKDIEKAAQVGSFLASALKRPKAEQTRKPFLQMFICVPISFKLALSI